jgi:hypothetical protein
MNMR